MTDFNARLRRLSTPKFRRAASIAAFWALIGILVLEVLQTYLVDGETQQSAYGDDWNDLGAFRSEINSLGVETNALVSSPLLLSEIDHPEEAIFVVSGVERDTISLPRFTGDENVIEFTEGDGYTTSEILAIESFVQRGGTVILLDDFGYSAQLASQFGLDYSGHRLYDGQAYAHELDYNFVWVNTSSAFNFTTNSGSLSSINPCLKDLDKDGVIDLLDEDPLNPSVTTQGISSDMAGLCAHRFDQATSTWDFSEGYDILTNGPSAFEKATSYNPVENRYAIGRSTLDSYLDTNDDGNLTVGFEAAGIEDDEQGPFAVYVRYCQNRLCLDSDSGRVHFVSDGSMLINSLYSPDYVPDYSGLVPDNDNRKWALDIIAEALLIGNSSTEASENAIVIFDESRHQQSNIGGDTYNLLYYLLIYFTNDWMAMLLLFLGLFIALEAVLIRKEDPDDWRHVFRIIYYGFGDARRYEYYQRPEKIRQVLLTRVRNVNAMSREEFDALPAAELQKMVDDNVLTDFIFNDRRYKTDELVGIVKRIKEWGRTESDSGA
ncbi:MAG: hypothetical protein CMB15_01510 [Euryarchaeota archaeon]|nr:hypothetical protein [Euryarchaeota archaeon]MDC0212335.1 hypothetical protein [Euryarchaeota archaeon]|tara:strand:+ start:231 stop:1874 length:1644 start_codon:yes stop_codon:yes gene_type:complete